MFPLYRKPYTPNQPTPSPLPTDVRIEIKNFTGWAWRCVHVYKLPPELNDQRRNVFIDTLDVAGTPIRRPIAWSWVGRHADEIPAPIEPKTDPTWPMGDFALFDGMNASVWVNEPDIMSDVVTGLHTAHPDEAKANGELGCSYGHHSYYIVFQRVYVTAAPSTVPTVPTIQPTTVTITPTLGAALLQAEGTLVQLNQVIATLRLLQSQL